MTTKAKNKTGKQAGKKLVLKKETLREVLLEITEREGRGQILWPFRVALSGLAASPDPIEIAAILGKEEVLRRLDVALDKLK